MMTEDVAPAAAGRPKLSLAMAGKKPADTTADAADEAITQPQFATTGEAFKMLLNKAKSARSDRKASGDD